ncbi:hypothetical protein ABIE26_001173 [Pedobacter africanus]|uniref:Uncharacterized protein n=1 Tax=Pedobacter africanus TaxID=151894 RepID=A0ACC6KT65_9SPHI|nr:hypothetical protein [Pedobacter africanus]MDR6782339.1 hypothetical protein [Pedobacter africanus]
MKKTYVIVAILLSSFGGFYLLTSITQTKSPTGFKREFVDSEIKLSNSYEFQNRAFDFLWKSGNDIWFLNYRSPLKPLKTNSALTEPKEVTLEIPNGFDTTVRTMNFDRLDSTIFVTNAKSDIMLSTPKHSTNYKVPSLLFDIIKGISPTSVVVRGFNFSSGQAEAELAKIKLSKLPETVKRFKIPKQSDGFYSTDGKLHYDVKSAKLFYMFFYRGEFLCLDTNLNLLYKANTIDTVRTAKVTFGPYTQRMVNGKSVKSRKLLKRLENVNRSITVEGDYIYIHSYLKADNETKEMTQKNEPIDIYSIKDGKYVHSIYLPRYFGKRLRNFRVDKNKIVAIYENRVNIFDLKTN